MKINCGPTQQELYAIKRKKLYKEAVALSKWHPWFAWLPTRVGSGDCRWLETIERRFKFWNIEEWSNPESTPVCPHYWRTEYRAK